MTIAIKFFASLRETVGQAENSLNSSSIMTVDDAWREATNSMDMPANMLIAVNMEYVERGARVKDGDEVAFFPPVTGG
ncbi:MAG: MoaD/ThiS family protein [Gammaproteobacteria bacterium]|nr:MoaD/ThiS family protein [Gammaproteobacteria bacterium]